jgi:ribosomal protein S18 acetylase RimI-like enzyme
LTPWQGILAGGNTVQCPLNNSYFNNFKSRYVAEGTFDKRAEGVGRRARISVPGTGRRSRLITADMDGPRIRAATAADASVVRQIVAEAYCHYIPRIGKPPAPMLDDYAARISEGVVWVIEEGSAVAGIIVLKPQPEYLLLDNIAVSPARQGSGLGRRLLAFAEAEAMRRGYREIRLYTHQTMTENQRLYAAIGYQETGRGTADGYERVFMCKRIAG